MDDIDESDAYVAYIEIMAGKPAPEVKNPTREFILSLRKLMINDNFIKAKSSLQSAFIKYVNKNIDSFEMRDSLEQMSQGDPETMRPQNPIQPPMQTQPQFGPQDQGMMPGAMPPAPTMSQGQPMMPPSQMPMGAPETGMPVPNPAAPQTAPMGNPMSLPLV